MARTATAFFLVLFGLATSPALARQADTNNAPATLVEDTNTTSIASTNQAEQANQDKSSSSLGIKFSDGKNGSIGIVNIDSKSDSIVVYGHDAELKAGETTQSVVVFGGNARVHGTVNDAVVVFGGNAYVDGKVHDAVVAIGGNAFVNGEVKDAVVAILGNIDLGADARVEGDAVSIGGALKMADGAKVKGDKQSVDLGPLSFHADWLKKWIRHCLFKLRPLAPQVGFVWVFAACFFLLYLVVALLFPGAVTACVEELTRRPATTFFMGLLTKFLLPLFFTVLAITVVGLVVVPFVVVALFFGAILGKAALLEWLGFKLGRLGNPAFSKPIIALLLGALLLTLLYMVPVVGFGTMLLFGVWGLGGAVVATFSKFRREKPPKAPQPTASRPQPAPTPAMTAAANPGAATAAGFSAPQATVPPLENMPPELAAQPAPLPIPVPDVLSHPRAGFWIRLAAGFLDLVIVCFLGGITGGVLNFPPLGFLVALSYFVGMWTWKGTTVGGALFGLRIVRLDGQHLTLLIAIVRALAGLFSVIFFFLGILWIAWDNDKQGWHDRLAGTVVLRLPRSMPLVMI